MNIRSYSQISTENFCCRTNIYVIKHAYINNLIRESIVFILAIRNDFLFGLTVAIRNVQASVYKEKKERNDSVPYFYQNYLK